MSDQLTKFGVTGFSPELAGQMQKVWDRRNLIAHSTEPEIAATEAQEFISAAEVINSFSETIDRFVVASCRHAV